MSERADEMQRRCRFPMFRGAVTGRLITCGVCPECIESERIRAEEASEPGSLPTTLEGD